jgi:hypothetical protein
MRLKKFAANQGPSQEVLKTKEEPETPPQQQQENPREPQNPPAKTIVNSPPETEIRPVM